MYLAGVRPEWRLVKGSILAWVIFPVPVTMGDLFELAAGFVEQRIGLGATFHRTGFIPIGTQRQLIAHEIHQQILPQ
jgi:hypothetical protein